MRRRVILMVPPMSDPRFPDVRPPVPVVVACFLAASAASAVAQAPGTDPTKLLEQLKSLEETVTKARTGNNMAAVDAITEAITADSKAIALWIESVRETEFRDKDKKEAEFRAWRDGAGRRLSDPGAAGALRLHLQYLLLTIRVANATTDDERNEILPALLSYLDDLSRGGKDTEEPAGTRHVGAGDADCAAVQARHHRPASGCLVAGSREL